MLTTPDAPFETYDIVVLGAGYAGLMASLRLGRRRLGLRVALINAEEQFVERVRLQEAMVAPVMPRIASLSDYLARTPIKFIEARALSLDPVRCRVHIEARGSAREIGFTQLIYALGSHVDTSKTPGASRYAYRLDPGESLHSTAALRGTLHQFAGRPARVLAVGGGPLSIEAAGEVKSTWPEMDVTLVSATRAGDFTSDKVRAVLRRDLTKLGVALVDNERVSEITASEVVTANGRHFTFDVCIWAAGMRAPSIAREAGLTVDAQDRVVVDMTSDLSPILAFWPLATALIPAVQLVLHFDHLRLPPQSQASTPPSRLLLKLPGRLFCRLLSPPSPRRLRSAVSRRCFHSTPTTTQFFSCWADAPLEDCATFSSVWFCTSLPSSGSCQAFSHGQAASVGRPTQSRRQAVIARHANRPRMSTAEGLAEALQELGITSEQSFAANRRQAAAMRHPALVVLLSLQISFLTQKAARANSRQLPGQKLA
ncbi:Pyridine nucleotide-disulfide oxidoreductase [Rhizobium leguminosarum bv. trifolii WSM2297]|uniref:Pyridine nucleotide-disulfide oxidoreductase n=2 Tax=Rhizobium leguminosarum TaxID=384 RepID=J0CWH7_RHILT|nr:Pyridine nucleotide-disulfide oxidoreductase [Rhizobium leguminosarum bv. trifolii WSM2297]